MDSGIVQKGKSHSAISFAFATISMQETHPGCGVHKAKNDTNISRAMLIAHGQISREAMEAAVSRANTASTLTQSSILNGKWRGIVKIAYGS